VAERIVFDQAALRQLFQSADGPVGKDLARRAIRVEARAKQLCPVDTGRLRSSITHELATQGGQLSARIGTDVDYGKHVELGTARAAAQPFLRPGLDAAR
jgi:HK97 gp10 family phage protein